MNAIDELRKIKFTNKLEHILLKKRRAQTNLEEYQIRKQKQFKCELQSNENQICNLCQSFYVNYVTTICQHSCCQKCLFDHMLKCRNKCPICRKEFQDDFAYPCLPIDNWIGIAQKNNKDYKVKFQKRALWKERRIIKEYKLGMTLDILDTVFIWCVGEVKEIRYGKNDQPKQVLIHYIGWDKVYDEFIDVDSFRLSPKGINTSHKNVIQYQQSNMETLQRRLNMNQDTNQEELFQRSIIVQIVRQLLSLRNSSINNQNNQN